MEQINCKKYPDDCDLQCVYNINSRVKAYCVNCKNIYRKQQMEYFINQCGYCQKLFGICGTCRHTIHTNT